MKTRIMKKWIVVLLAFMVSVSGAIYVGTNANEVKAAASPAATLETGAVVLAATNVDVTGDVPVANIDTYKDYLFAGWFSAKECTLESAVTNSSGAYAKFVPADTMNVKVQISENAVTGPDGSTKVRAIRCISSVESLELSRVGFEIDGTIYYVNDNSVFERIESSIEDFADYEFSPKVVGTKSEYFVSANLPIATDDESLAKPHTITSVWKTIDGTVVKGSTRSVAVNDGASNVINMTLQGELVKGDTNAKTTFTSGSVNVTDIKAEVLEVSNGYSNVRITLPVGTNVINMKSATKITVTGSDSTSASGIFRNYYTTYANGGADITWYEVNTGATEFVIASDADMWGLESLVRTNKNSLFANDKVILVRDVTLIDGQVQPATETTEASWKYTNEGDTTTWPGIGTSTYNYKGSFDGDGNTISGVYMDKQVQGTGLFNFVATDTAIIENFAIKNSYIKNTKLRTGAVIGNFAGYLNNVYVKEDVVVVGDGQLGGLVGYFEYARTIKNCWFAGEVLNGSANSSVGGIVGTVYRAVTRTIENCLVTGTITTKKETNPYIGGILGYAWDGTVYVRNCMSQATFETMGTDDAGAIIGYGNADKTIYMQNVYADNEFLMKKASTAVATGKQNVLTESEYKGNEIKYHTALDFVTTENPNGVWAATAEGPELASFTEKTILKDVVTRTATKEWYYNAWTKDSGDTYPVSTATDMYGFAELVNNDVEAFAGDTVQLATDINLNPNWTMTANGSGELTGTTTTFPKRWTPIGTSTAKFKGTFDGQKKTISGVCVEQAMNGVGLFGIADTTAQIKNLILDNSYIKNNNAQTGAVVGYFYGTNIENVKVTNKVVVNGKNGVTGGITGIVGASNDKVVRTFSGCWVDCKMYTAGQNLGGIIGRLWGGDVTILNCLVTGEMKNTGNNNGTYPGAKVGSFVGANDNSGDNDLTIQDCLSMAMITVKNNGLVGDIIGRILDSRAGDNVVLNTYADTTRNSDYTYNSTVSGSSSLGATFEFDKADFATKDAAEVVPNLFVDLDTSSTKTGWGKVTGSYPVPAYWQ